MCGYHRVVERYSVSVFKCEGKCKKAWYVGYMKNGTAYYEKKDGPEGIKIKKEFEKRFRK